MTITDQLKRDEGLRLTVYRDSLGKLTIGYGRCLETEGITRDEAEHLLNNDVIAKSAELERALPWVAGLDDARRGVLVNMCFNIGVDGLLKFRQMLAACQSGDYATAAKEMSASLWAKQVGARADRLEKQMLTGEWVA